jgi:hypothetical protein
VRRSPAAPPPRPSTQTGPSHSLNPSPALPRPRAPASSPELAQPRRPPRPKGYIANPEFFTGSLLQKGISNSVVISLFIVNCVENRSKIRKMQNQFFLRWWWINLQLLLFWPELIPDSFCMKNTNVKKLDLQYLKIYKSSVSNFCICCVLGHD